MPIATVPPADQAVTRQPGAINCSSSGGLTRRPCTDAFASGTQVTLTYTLGLNSSNNPGFFGGWFGCDSTSGQTCTVAMNNVRNVEAIVDAVQP